MPQVPARLEITTMRFCGSWLSGFVDNLRKTYERVARIMNGQLSFGDGLSPDNINGRWVDVVSPVGANTDFTVSHNLGRLPVGYWIMQSDKSCNIYTGSIAATTTQLTLKADVASATLKLFVL